MGQPGSETRNQVIAAVFHETNLAETKGSGIRAMRRLMKASHLTPPTFESNRVANSFTMRLLLHHFLGEEDLQWLQGFERYKWTDAQKQALVFAREVGAVDNATYRQMSDCDTLRASKELRELKEQGLLQSKGNGSATYYVLNTYGDALSLELKERLEALGKRMNDPQIIQELVLDLCRIRPMSLKELSDFLQRREDYLISKYIRPMLTNKLLHYLHPEMIKHPEQAYITNNRENNE